MKASARNNVKVRGEGHRVMVLAHGFGCDQTMWRFITPAFEKEFKIVLFDYVGHGGSAFANYCSDRYSSLEGYAQDVVEICDELGVKDITFVGHSVSAMVGVLMSVSRPDLMSRLILIGPSPCYLNEPGYEGGFTRPQIEELLEFLEINPAGWSSMMAPVIMGNSERPELSEELRESFCRTDPRVEKEFARVTFLSDNRLDLARVSVPTLVIQCSDDVIAPLQVGEYVHRKIKDSSFALLTVTGHCPHLSAPEETAEKMKEFLEVTEHPL